MVVKLTTLITIGCAVTLLQLAVQAYERSSHDEHHDGGPVLKKALQQPGSAGAEREATRNPATTFVAVNKQGSSKEA